MIDRVKNIVETILNKEKVGSITPEQYIDSCDKAQKKIYASYFGIDTLRDMNRESRGLAHGISKLLEQKLSGFAATGTISLSSGIGSLPSDFYFMNQRSMFYNSDVIVDMLSRSAFRRDKSSASTTFPIAYLSGDKALEVAPATITSVEVDYYKIPPKPKWTYTNVGGVPYFNPSASDFQDFLLHEDEESRIIVEILSDFGIVKREAEMTQLMNLVKQQESGNESRIL